MSQDLPGDTFVGPRFGMWRPTQCVRHGQADEGRRSHRAGHRQVAQGEPGHLLPVPSQRSCLGFTKYDRHTGLRVWSYANNQKRITGCTNGAGGNDVTTLGGPSTRRVPERGAVRACNRWRAAGRAGRPRRDRSPPRGAPVRRRRPQCRGHAGSPRPRCQPHWPWRSGSCRPRAPP